MHAPLLLDRTTFERPWEPWNDSWNHVWIFQYSRLVHCCSSCLGIGCLVDIQQGRRANIDRHSDWLWWWCNPCYPCGKLLSFGLRDIRYSLYLSRPKVMSLAAPSSRSPLPVEILLRLFSHCCVNVVKTSHPKIRCVWQSWSRKNTRTFALISLRNSKSMTRNPTSSLKSTMASTPWRTV